MRPAPSLGRGPGLQKRVTPARSPDREEGLRPQTPMTNRSGDG
jgi:hypothetical protein